ncbi:methyltransferase [Catenulispora acidiphila DSM 44928]|uniref:Histidine N-alpha-methyltransferase n=1 Tax=Catenulispora acidiphila (strain DSM 44928 / JCM 14897 / NBRC 102108 / NRRL B-24433 / ID139908) TaxID=479433 RepID=C7QH04_CATAD|nr:L-histidine N(alpha)-methyltransferase [Catenulispora acidiphila]ACU76854.1 methyltransferase [Catenulispora acidiphila DSM 44928]
MSGIEIERRLPEDFFAAALRDDVLKGLTAEPKWLPPKWFYDARGSELFEEITRLPEYYPTRAEREILATRAAEIAAVTRAETLAELGSGSSTKTTLLLDALRDAGTLRRYDPIDVSEAALLASGEQLQKRYPELTIHAVVTDFEERLAIPESAGARLVVFLGGTIGNLLPEERSVFLARLRAGLRPGEWLLLGTDLVKDPETLVAAYDDAAGVTAEFNKNVLTVVDRELDADFDPDDFDHVALWDPAAEWIEMRLRARRDLSVRLKELDLGVSFERGEELRTEISAKFRREGVARELDAAGFAVRHWWTDEQARFGLSLAEAV